MPCPTRTESPTRGGRRRAPRNGQSLVEFALIVSPLLLLILAIVQFGFIFNSYVTLTNAAREAAREGTIYVYDRTLSQTANDGLRNEQVRTTILAALNGMQKASPQFANSSTWTSATSGSTLTYTTGDLSVAYTLPAGITANDPRRGYQVTVRAVYHLDILLPIIGSFLPKDGGGRLQLTGETTMVVN